MRVHLVFSCTGISRLRENRSTGTRRKNGVYLLFTIEETGSPHMEPMWCRSSVGLVMSSMLAGAINFTAIELGY